MKERKNPNQGDHIKVPFKFDDAIKRAMTVKPPIGGWADYEKKLKRQRERQRQHRKVAS